MTEVGDVAGRRRRRIRYPWTQCLFCRRYVADNWWVRHYRSHCRTGGREQVPQRPQPRGKE